MPPKNLASAKFDFKKVYKDYYAPKLMPSHIFVPMLSFVSMQGVGNPNELNGAYQIALKTLYTLSYTLKMSKRILRANQKHANNTQARQTLFLTQFIKFF